MELIAQTVAPTNNYAGGMFTGWTFEARHPGSVDQTSLTAAPDFVNAPIPLPPSTAHTSFAYVANDEAMSTTISGLTIGEAYVFTFDVGAFAPFSVNAGRIFRVAVGNNVLTDARPSESWQTFQLNFTANSTTETIHVGGPVLSGAVVNPVLYDPMILSIGTDAVQLALPPCRAGTVPPILQVNN